MLVRLVLAIVTLAGPVSAQDTNIEDGRDLFLYFCAECHGKDAASAHASRLRFRFRSRARSV